MKEHENMNTHAATPVPSNEHQAKEDDLHNEERYPKGNKFVRALIFIGWLLLAQIPLVTILLFIAFLSTWTY